MFKHLRSGLFRSARSAQVAPIHIWPERFAPYSPSSRSLYRRAILRRDASASDPLLHGLIPSDVERLSRLDRPAEQLNRMDDRSLGVHTLQFIQENLAMQDSLAVTQENLASSIICMETIHERLFRLRKKFDLSLQQVGDACGATWQAAQQWEGGGKKPTVPRAQYRKRLAELYAITEIELMYGSAAEQEQAGIRRSANSSRNVERLQSASSGSVKWPFSIVSVERFMALPIEGRSYVEGRLMSAIEEWEARSSKRIAQ